MQFVKPGCTEKNKGVRNNIEHLFVLYYMFI